jgi:hypothetical protein
MPSASFVCVLLLLLVTLSLGCQRSAPTTVSAKPGQTTSAAQGQAATSSTRPVQSSYEPASDAEIEEFGHQVATAVFDQDIDHLDNVIDWQFIHNRSTETVHSSRELKSVYLETLGSVSGRPILSAWMSAASSGGSFTFLGARDLDGQKSALFRIIQPTGGVNYCDMRVGRSTNGDLRCIDLRNFTTGEYLSETFRHDFRLLVAKHEVGNSTPEFEAFLEHADEFSQIAETVRNGDGALGRERIAKLPSVLQANRRVLILKIQACMHLDDDALLSAISEFSDRFPNDPAAKLYAIQANFLLNQHQTARRLLEELDKAIGGDPYLDALCADLYFQQTEIQTAKRIAMEVIEEEQGLDLAYWTLARVAVEEGAFADAVKWLDMLQRSEGRMEAIEEDLHEYSEFLDSGEFVEWKERRKTDQ